MADYIYFKRKLMDGSQVTHMELNVVDGADDNKNITSQRYSAEQMLKMNFKPKENPDVTFSPTEIRPGDTNESDNKKFGDSDSNKENDEKVRDKKESKKKSKSKQKNKSGGDGEKIKVTEGKGKRASKKGKKVKKSKRKGKKSPVKTEREGNNLEEENDFENEMQIKEKQISRTTEEITKVTTFEQRSGETKETQQPIPKPRSFEITKQIQNLSFGTTEISSGKKGIGGRGKINPGVSKLLAFPMGKVDILMRSLMPHKAKLSKKGIQELTTLLQVYVVFLLRQTISFKQELKSVDGKDIRKSIRHHSTLNLIQNIINYK